MAVGARQDCGTPTENIAVHTRKSGRGQKIIESTCAIRRQSAVPTPKPSRTTGWSSETPAESPSGRVWVPDSDTYARLADR